ncbi:autotransporter domain-containing protein [Pseudomonas argentinensis]|uniref:Outer membrane autotransporter barrel domain-containing protein n=1 Tax=Phytopseudomonas argentinensis TaxID=289370 RepID=A0A1I3HTN3_9GAMM|nr:autotransporter outer membrane beta-barrel domain-containing protein [Pseudomonas argentinensis]KAB0548162.1 autotransporter domain-containing protein [Pseudomonas argentinensis]SFI38927.1 outer membrane autotransporter barrel domain-containing protein [Pseudomonas argentinensis]
MQHSPLSLSLLTLAIAAASLSAEAETYQIDNGPKSWENVVIADGLSIGGELTTPANALTLKPGTHVQGDLIIDASINTTGAESSQERYSRPLTLGEGLIAFSDEVRIDGGLINKGNLIANGISAVGIQGRNLSIDGTLSNTGLISVRDTYILDAQNHLLGDAMPAGISLSETRVGSLSNSGRIEVISADIGRGIELIRTPLAGALENTSSGSVEVTGDEVHAIAVNFKSDLAELINAGTVRATGIKSRDDSRNLSEANGITVGDSIVRGRLLNSGTITVSGYEATGIDLIAYSGNGDQARVDGDLVNSGSIDVTAVDETGATARAIDISNATIGGKLNNSGSITASGADSVGIYVEKSRIAGDIINSGTIKGDRAGIYLSSMDSNSNLPGYAPFSIIYQNGGLIEGGEYAIYSDTQNNNSRLIWGGGTIKGNVHGMTYIDIVGDATFDGDHLNDGDHYGGVDIYNADDSPLGRPGKLTLLKPHVTLDGYLEMNRGTVLQLNLSDATDPDKAILKVKEEAYFSEESSIALRPTSEAFRAAGKEYKLVHADGGIEYDGDRSLVVSSSPLLTVNSSRITGTEVLATVSSVSDQQASEVLGQAGSSPNARRAFQPFYANVMPQLDSSDPVFQAFANAEEAQLAALSEQLTPQVDGAVQAAANAVQSMVSGAVGSRTSSLRGASSGSPFSETGFWVQGHDSDLRQGRRSGIAGYDADSRGLSLGLDGKLDEQWTLGVAYSNLDTKVSGRTGNKSEIDSQVLTLYSGFEQGPVFVDTSLSYGFNDNTSKRNIAGTRAKGDFDSQSLALNLEAGYGLHAGSVTLEPRVATRYSRLDIDSYREKGSSAALAVSSQRYEAIELGAGARLASQFSVGQGTLEPELKLMAYHDFAADRASSTSSFVLGGSSFVTHGASPARDSYEASLGVNYRLGALSLGAGYEHVGRSGFDADTLRAKVRYDF